MLFVKFCNNLHDPSTRHMTYFTACVEASPRAEVLRIPNTTTTYILVLVSTLSHNRKLPNTTLSSKALFDFDSNLSIGLVNLLRLATILKHYGTFLLKTNAS